MKSTVYGLRLPWRRRSRKVCSSVASVEAALRVRVVLLSILFLVNALYAHGQDPAGLEQGIKLFGSYDGGNIDTVSMVNGSLSLHIPLVSYPQVGGKLKVGFSIIYSTPILTPSGRQSCNIAGECFPAGVSYNLTRRGITIVPDFGPGVFPNTTVLAGNQNSSLVDYSVTEPDGATHHLGETDTTGASTNWIARDASGYALNINSLTLTDRDGIRYFANALPQTTFMELRGDQ